jgi:putative redox protein
MEQANRPASWHAQVKDDEIVVRTGRSYRTEVRAKGFDLIADEPEALGGTNAGPSPFDYVAIALASCKSLTLRMYADRKGLAVEAITVSVRYCRKPKPDDPAGAKLDTFECAIAIDGAVDDSVKARMLELAERCPIHRMLTAEVQIVSRLAATG